MVNKIFSFTGRKIIKLKLLALINQYHDQLTEIYSPSEAKAITRIIVQEVTGWNQLDIALHHQSEVEIEKENLILAILKRLMTHEPMQYILGYEIFCGLKFIVNPDVLIPRPETEDLVRWIVEIEKNPKKILDIGTGSGCIAIALKYFLPKSEVFAVEVSKDALVVAQQNATLNKLTVTFELQDIIWEEITSKFDIIVSNPPYVGLDEKHEMFKNVLAYEPHLALFAKDPLFFYDVISEIAKTALEPNGKIYFECNEYYTDKIALLLKNKGYQEIAIKKDFAEKDRMISAKWH